MKKPNAVIFDLDGCLADVTEYRHYVVKSHPDFSGKKDFRAFHSESIAAPRIENICHLAKSLSSNNAILIVTARKTKWMFETMEWLDVNEIPYIELHMRPDSDGRKAEDVKLDILNSIRNRYNVVLAVDDSPYNVQMFIKNGIPTTLVPGWQD